MVLVHYLSVDRKSLVRHCSRTKNIELNKNNKILFLPAAHAIDYYVLARDESESTGGAFVKNTPRFSC
jgi:hypothetical protein